LIEEARDLAQGRSYLEVSPKLEKTLARTGRNESTVFAWTHPLASIALSSFQSRQIKLTVEMEARRRMAITAIALERYRTRRGDYPDRLSGLVPELVVAIPVDPVDGMALRYARTADGGFRLYSVGLDGRDNGGARQTDLVWPRTIPVNDKATDSQM
jgi:hypothetical protein